MERSNGFHFFLIIDFYSVVFAINWKTGTSTSSTIELSQVTGYQKSRSNFKSSDFFQLDFGPNQVKISQLRGSVSNPIFQSESPPSKPCSQFPSFLHYSLSLHFDQKKTKPCKLKFSGHLHSYP